MGVARFERKPRYGFADCPGAGARQADDTDATTAGGRGYCGDGIGLTQDLAA